MKDATPLNKCLLKLERTNKLTLLYLEVVLTDWPLIELIKVYIGPIKGNSKGIF